MRRSQAPSQKFQNIKEKNYKRKRNSNSEEQIPLEKKQKLSQHESLIQSILSKPFRVPIENYKGTSTNFLGIRKLKVRQSLFDPNEEDALVLYEPSYTSHFDKEISEVHGLSICVPLFFDFVVVVVNPTLTKVLRPHQREGVKFIYDCVTGVNDPSAFGCIIADDMGLGKTLQCVTLVDTLLTQGPEATPIISNCIIVSPASLVNNWANEFKKWLGAKISCLVIEGGAKEKIIPKLKEFIRTGRRRSYSLLIISYDTFRLYSPLLNSKPIGLLICDEGHRLKNSQNQTYITLDSLKTKLRILVSGTPIQNDLLEFYSLLNFVNPGLLGTANEFKRNFGNYIEKGRDALASEEENQKGQEKLNELTSLVNRFIIRRTASINKQYLPSKVVQVVFCNLSSAQKEIYKKFLQSKEVNELLRNSTNASSCLSNIINLKKLCNHPILLFDQLCSEKGPFSNCKSFLPEISKKSFLPELSGKVKLLDNMLARIKATTNDKVVLISNYTQTLDYFEIMCRERKYFFIRLDGSLSIKKRQSVVDLFNDTKSKEFIFLLSSRAGGCGLNLIGANRLIVFDPDWNPATDLQAMGRIWRDGQKKKCYIYRFISTGTIEEKIFQRQTHKQALSSCVVDEEENVERHFSKKDLKELFKFNEQTLSDTHDTFQCKKCVGGVSIQNKSLKIDDNSEDQIDMSKWNHYGKFTHLEDKILKNSLEENVTFIFQKEFS